MEREEIEKIKTLLTTAFFEDSAASLKPLDCFKIRKYILNLEEAARLKDSCLALTETTIKLMAKDLLEYTGLPGMTPEDIEEIYIEKAEGLKPNAQ